MIVYKVNVLRELFYAGYNCTDLRRNKILSESTLTKLRNGKYVDMSTLDKICKLTHLKICDLIEYVED